MGELSNGFRRKTRSVLPEKHEDIAERVPGPVRWEKDVLGHLRRDEVVEDVLVFEMNLAGGLRRQGLIGAGR